MCGGSKSTQQTQASETVNTTYTDYGAIKSATEILGQAQELVAAQTMSPQEQTMQLLVVGGVLIGVALVLKD